MSARTRGLEAEFLTGAFCQMQMCHDEGLPQAGSSENGKRNQEDPRAILKKAGEKGRVSHSPAGTDLPDWKHGELIQFCFHLLRSRRVRR